MVLVGVAVSAQEPATLRAHGPLLVQAAGPDNGVASPNWSGYAIAGGPVPVSEVSGSWVVPAANCGPGVPAHTGASHWVGIDGYFSRTVEQTGTDSDCVKGQPVYYAWYEFYPKPGKTIRTMAVHAGDVMKASVRFDDGRFTIRISNLSTGQEFNTSASVPGARRNSAEWIAEDNSAHFTRFGTALFGQDETGVPETCFARLDIGPSLAIGTFPPKMIHAITLVNHRGVTRAVPSTLSGDGSSFTVQGPTGP
jgi:hypothetical protein